MGSFQSAADQSWSDSSPPEEDVRAELSKILSGHTFEKSQRRRDFLRFVVEETLSGRGDRIKGFAIATEVLGRDETFDGKSDPAVRIEARRLRRELEIYYFTEGVEDPVRIYIPKGAYVPRFEWHAVSNTQTRDRNAEAVAAGTVFGVNQRGAAAVLTLVAAIVFTIGFVLSQGIKSEGDEEGVTPLGPPKILVENFAPLDTSEMSQSLAVGLPSEIFFDLSKFEGLHLYMPVDKEDKTPNSQPVSTNARTFVLKGNVHSDSSSAEVQAQFVSTESGEILWSERYTVPHDSARFRDIRTDVSAQIATVLGQPYGPLGSALQSESESGDAASSDSYLCVMRSYSYRRSFSVEKFAPTLECLEAAVLRDPTYADAWAMLGWLYLDAGRFRYPEEATLPHFRRAAAAAERALELEPNNVLGLKALSSIRHYMGEYGVSVALARRAAALNPYDPDTLAQLGWRFVMRENFDEGVPLLNEAIQRSVDPPGWYFQLLLIEAYLEGDFDRMFELAERSVKDGSSASYAYLTVAAVGVGDMDRAASAAVHVPADSAYRQDPASVFRLHGATERITERMSAALNQAFARVAASVVR